MHTKMQSSCFHYTAINTFYTLKVLSFPHFLHISQITNFTTLITFLWIYFSSTNVYTTFILLSFLEGSKMTASKYLSLKSSATALKLIHKAIHLLYFIYSARFLHLRTFPVNEIDCILICIYTFSRNRNLL